MEELAQITISAQSIATYILGGLLTVVGFFLKNAWDNVNKLREQRTLDKEELGKLKGKIELVAQGSDLGLEKLSENIDKLASEVHEMNAKSEEKHKDMMSIFSKLLKSGDK